MRVNWSVERKKKRLSFGARHFLVSNVIVEFLLQFFCCCFFWKGSIDFEKYNISTFVRHGETHCTDRNQKVESGQTWMWRNSCSKFVVMTCRITVALILAVAAHKCTDRPTAPNLGHNRKGFKALCLSLFKWGFCEKKKYLIWKREIEVWRGKSPAGSL